MDQALGAFGHHSGHDHRQEDRQAALKDARQAQGLPPRSIDEDQSARGQDPQGNITGAAEHLG